MADFNFLSNPSAQPQPTNLLGMAGQAMTLGSMAQQQQLQALNLQKQQDLIDLYGSPQGANFLQSLLGGGSASGGGPQGASSQLDASFLGGHAAAPEFIQTALGLAEKQAQIQKNQADSAKSRQETADMELQNVGRVAASLPTDPKDPNYNPQLNQQVAMSIAQRLHATGIPGILQSFDTTSPDTLLASAGAGLMDPKTRQDLLYKPIEAQQKNVGEARLVAEVNKPELKLNEMTGQMERVTPFPGAGPQLPPLPQIPGQPGAQAAPQQGTPASPLQKEIIQPGQWSGTGPNPGTYTAVPGAGLGQFAQTPQQKTQTGAAADELKQLVAGSQAASGMKAMLEDMRSQEAQGIYSGGIQGQPAFKQVANVLAAANLLSPDQANKLANTQAWDVESKNLVAQAVKQFVGGGGRVAARELDFMGKAKPEDLQTPQGREIVYNTLWKISDRINQQANQAGQYFQKNGELTGFTPQFTSNSMPNPVVPGLPDPSTKPGWQAKSADGHLYQSDGTKWNLLK